MGPLQFYPEAAALSGFGFHTGSAAHAFSRLADQGETNACSLGIPGELLK